MSAVARMDAWPSRHWITFRGTPTSRIMWPAEWWSRVEGEPVKPRRFERRRVHAIPEVTQEVDDSGQKHGGCRASLTADNITPNLADFCRDPVVRAEAAELAGVEEVNRGQCVQILRDFLGV